MGKRELNAPRSPQPPPHHQNHGSQVASQHPDDALLPQPFYGPELDAFSALLTRLDVPHSVIDYSLGNTSVGFERDMPMAAHVVGLMPAALGLFETS